MDSAGTPETTVLFGTGVQEAVYGRITGQQRAIDATSIQIGSLADVVAARRSQQHAFTVSALSWNPCTADLLDPAGGTTDLAAGLLRLRPGVVEPDPLLALRAMELAGRFDLAVEPATARYLADTASSFHLVPADQVWSAWEAVALDARTPSMSLRAVYEMSWQASFLELAAVKGIEQDPIWHPEGTVDVHLGLSADAAVEIADQQGLTGDDRIVVVLGALLHDLGKATHSVRNSDGRITSYGHARAGVAPVRSFLRRIGAPTRFADLIAPIIAEHMAHVGGDPTPAAVRRLTDRLSGGADVGPTLELWAAVVAADCAGRSTGSKPSAADAWLQLAAAMAERDRTSSAEPAILTGAHLIRAGFQPGPGFRPILEAAEAAQRNGEFHDEAGAVQWLASR